MTTFNGYAPPLIAVGVGAVALLAGAVDLSPAVALAGGGGLAGATALAWLCRGRQSRSDTLDAVLATAPHPWCRVRGGDITAAAPGFASLLGGSLPARLEAIAAALVPADAAAFAAASEELGRSGIGFRLEVESREGRRLVLTGAALAEADEAGDGGNGAMVLWAEDGTAAVRAHSAAERARHAAESAAGVAETETVRLRTALEALPLPVWMRSEDLAVIWCNRAYARAVEAEPAAAVAEARELVPDGGARPMAARARAEGVAQSRRYTVAFGTERRLLEVTEVSLPLPQGDALALGFALDVTETETLRSELARHQAAHAEVLERLGSAISVFGPDMRLKFHNQAYARLWELDEAFLRTEPTHGEVLEDLRARRKLPEYADFPSFKRERLAQYTRLIEPMEEMMHLPDGTTLRVLLAPHPLGGLIMIMEDVTNTLALESSYNTLMAVQQETLDNLAEGIAVYGGDGRLKLSNPSYARIWNLSDQDLQGEPHIADILEHMRPFFVDETVPGGPSGGAVSGGFGFPPMAGWGGDWDFLKDEMIGATLERAVRSGRLERRDGSVVEFSTVPLPDGAVLTSYLDVTDSARLEQALRASNAALEAADQLKTEFIANVSHHLRTPLNSIMGYADMLAGQYFGPLTPRQAECVTSMQTAGERLLGLIDDVVDLASIGAGVTALERGPVDLADVVETVAGLTQEWARREELRLDVTIAPGLGTLEGDDKRLKQALFTLVVAAIRSRPADGRVVLRAERTGDGARLTVGDPAADTGGRRFDSAPPFDAGRFGTPPFDGARFEPAGTDPALGLALVRNVIDLHGGRMEVSEAPGCGLLVRCSLPVTAVQAG
ncbi:signal transduction histidine kinase [Azospirillum fermentarium]|uniref:sensor histidine kinase n=1 Tax=Azospirillum fermentarium TaxID=1233114 RepID=UPI00222693B8|nr:PAS domain-containing sensor histidine kinase [Azospirillum fermentarium]MCW2245376.1 signal transduction histidine kinase [Azospirillum fermentarium]